MAEKMTLEGCLKKWWPNILSSKVREMNQCIEDLEARFKKPYTTELKCYGRGGNSECGEIIKPDARCTVDGASYSEWFADNSAMAEGCAKKLRALGYRATTRLIPRTLLADIARVLVAK